MLFLSRGGNDLTPRAEGLSGAPEEAPCEQLDEESNRGYDWHMENFRAIRRVLWITLGLNLLATAAKLIVGYWTGSLSLVNAPDPGQTPIPFRRSRCPRDPVRDAYSGSEWGDKTCHPTEDGRNVNDDMTQLQKLRSRQAFSLVLHAFQ